MAVIGENVKVVPWRDGGFCVVSEGEPFMLFATYEQAAEVADVMTDDDLMAKYLVSYDGLEDSQEVAA